jgi:hypothetical protein
MLECIDVLVDCKINMSKLITEQDYSDELTRFYGSEVIDPSKPFPLHFENIVHSLVAKKDKMSFKTSANLGEAAICITLFSFFYTVGAIIPLGFYSLLGLLGIAGGIILGETSSKYSLSEYKHVESLREESLKNTAYKNAYRLWLHERYDFPIRELTDDVLASSVFVINNKYFAKSFNNVKDEITSIREASAEEIVTYQEEKFKAENVLKEAPLSQKVKDKLEVTYL